MSRSSHLHCLVLAATVYTMAGCGDSASPAPPPPTTSTTTASNDHASDGSSTVSQTSANASGTANPALTPTVTPLMPDATLMPQASASAGSTAAPDSGNIFSSILGGGGNVLGSLTGAVSSLAGGLGLGSILSATGLSGLLGGGATPTASTQSQPALGSGMSK